MTVNCYSKTFNKYFIVSFFGPIPTNFTQPVSNLAKGYLMRLFGLTFMFLALWQCHTTEVIVCPPQECTTKATVKDLSELDGCGLVFELEDGTILEPERRVYVMPPKPEEDPLYYFELIAGQKVIIGYESSNAGSICMAGEMVFVTCIQSVQTGGAE
jgi:hypothetical protein